jgi:hypothetical protein
MSYICANDEYRSQVGATRTNQPENIVIHYVSFVSLSSICMYTEKGGEIFIKRTNK